MEHIGIDLGGKESQICVRSDQGEILEEARCPAGLVTEFLARRAPGRIAFETRTEAFKMADLVKGQGHDVRVVSATLVRSLGVGRRKLKNDVRDARVLSEASCRIDLPSVHIPTTASREVKALCTSREALVKARTQMVARIRSYLRSRIRKPLRAIPESLPGKVRDALLQDPEGLPLHVERLLVVIESLNDQIKSADAELKELAGNDERTRRLMTVPGVGPATAARYVATIDDVDRFPNASYVASYLGLTPGENTTGFKTRRTRLTRAGAPQVRWALGQAAWSLYLRRPQDPMAQWARRVAERRGVQIAITALARKLSQVLYAMWKTKTNCSPLHALAPAVTH